MEIERDRMAAERDILNTGRENRAEERAKKAEVRDKIIIGISLASLLVAVISLVTSIAK